MGFVRRLTLFNYSCLFLTNQADKINAGFNNGNEKWDGQVQRVLQHKRHPDPNYGKQNGEANNLPNGPPPAHRWAGW